MIEESLWDLWYLGWYNYHNKNDSKAIMYFKEAAQKGDNESFDVLSYLYGITFDKETQSWIELDKEYTIDEDDCEIKILEETARKHGRANDYLLLAKKYERVNIIDRSLECYEKAAELGDVESYKTLGYFYENGDNIHVNLEKAIRWYEKYKEVKGLKNYLRLGDCCTKLANIYYKKGEYIKAVKCWRKAKDNNNEEAFLKLGLCYYNGTGVRQNYDKALDIFNELADKNNTDAFYYLGLHYRSDRCIDQNEERGLELLKKSAQQGNIKAYSFLNCLNLYYKHIKKLRKKSIYYALDQIFYLDHITTL